MYLDFLQFIFRQNVYEGMIISVFEEADGVYFRPHGRDSTKLRDSLFKYFRLEENLESLYSTWAHAEKEFAECMNLFPGIRLLKQPPFESLLSFVCSQNNIVPWITSMVMKLKEFFGQQIEGPGQTILYAFPTPNELIAAPNLVEQLKNMGFGYRARYIAECARMVAEGFYLEILRNCSSSECIDRLITLPGVGPKVAGCVALTGLGHMDIVPIDTHMRRIAAKLDFSKNQLNDKLHKELYVKFCDRFGDKAGWAHLVLFASQLRKAKKALTSKRKR